MSEAIAGHAAGTVSVNDAAPFVDPWRASLSTAHMEFSRRNMKAGFAALLAAREQGAPDVLLLLADAFRYKMLQDHAAALAINGEALKVDPLNWVVLTNRGIHLQDMGRWEEAIECYRSAMRTNFGYPMVWVKLGICHLRMRNYAEALACIDRAVALAPDDAEAVTALGTMMQVFENDAQAEDLFRRALAVGVPDDFAVMAGLGFILLRQMRWAEGWDYFEARHRRKPFGTPWDYVAAPVWQGDSREFAEARVLLVTEQGYGDSIQFARYVPMVAGMADRCWLVCEPPLERLFSGLGAELLIRNVKGEYREGVVVPEHDICVPLMSLPRAFGTVPDRVPPPASFPVTPKPSEALVGLCWHGGSRPEDPEAHNDDERRSVPYELFEPLTAIAPCTSLQMEHLPAGADWRTTAEIVAGLRLVITVDTAIAHLAASLGVETWCLLRKGGCWRWGTVGDRTPWYPTMKLYRQPVIDAWEPVLRQVADDLRTWAEGRV